MRAVSAHLDFAAGDAALLLKCCKLASAVVEASPRCGSHRRLWRFARVLMP